MLTNCNSHPYVSFGVVVSVGCVFCEIFDIYDEHTQLDVLTEMGVSTNIFFSICYCKIRGKNDHDAV